MSNTQQIFQSPDDMPAEVASAVLHWILSVADTKHRIGFQFSRWVTGTPALEAAVGAAAITQDELGHARSLYALLKDYPGAPDGVGAENDLQARDLYYVPHALTPDWESWLHVVAVMTLLDHALQIAIMQMDGSAYKPLAGRVAKMVQEEKFHRIFGKSWVERLVQRDDNTKEKLQTSIDWAWRLTDAWIGPADEAVTTQLVAAGVLKGDATTIRQQWLDAVSPLLTDNGLTRPDDIVDWSGWDSQFRAISSR
ncbi:MAG: Phenylacetic acid catabolic protein [Chloroflexota bacterium]